MKLFKPFHFLFLIVLSCKTVTNPISTKRNESFHVFSETEIKLPIKTKFVSFSYIDSDTSEFLAYQEEGQIKIVNLHNKVIEDSIGIVFDSSQFHRYGNITSFCFEGRDSLFLLLDEGIFFAVNKKLQKIIPINRNDPVQFKKIRFSKLQTAPIYYDRISNGIVGRVYCSKCRQNSPSFYKHASIGEISLSSGKLTLFNFAYPEKYIRDYYGFANQIYIDSKDSITLASFPCDDVMYILNRNTNTTERIGGKSIFQTTDAVPLPRKAWKSREAKMEHFTVTPFYSEVLYDRYRKLYYRFFWKDIPLKNKDGKYNSLEDKRKILMVFNSKNEIIGEYELSKYYTDYVSFVGKSGLYIRYISPDPRDSDQAVFKIFTFDRQ